MTPTEELVLGCLGARIRLGHTCWTFGTKHGHALKRLAEGGWIEYKNGIVENTYLVFPTSQFLNDEEWFLPDYVPPIQGGPK